MEKHVTVICIKEGLEVGDTLHAKVLAFAFGLAVDIERSLIAARTREALARRRQEGQRLGRPPGSLSKQTKLTGRDEEIQTTAAEKGRGVSHCAHSGSPSDDHGQLHHLAMPAKGVRA